MAKVKFYSVRKGNKVGIFKTWAECQASVKGYSGAEYKSFENLEDAERYLSNKVESIDKINISEVKEDEMIAYVDGSYDSKIGYYSYGAITFLNGEKKEFSDRGNDKNLLDMRNVAGEILGAKAAMSHAIDMKVKKLYLHYDYEGIEKWATSAWEAKKEGTKEYKNFYDRISKDLDVVFIKVKAHSGDKYNEEVDQLAKMALLKESTNKEAINKKSTDKKSRNKEDFNSAEFISSKVNSKSLTPIFNIIMPNNHMFNTDSLIAEFKKVWKNKQKKLSDINDLKIVMDINKMKAIFKVETDIDNYEIEIELY